MRALILVYALFSTAAVPAQISPAALSLPGVVTDLKTRGPVVGARVSLAGGLAAHDEITDSKGNFVLSLSSGVIPGQIVRLRVDKDGYEPYDENVPVGGTLPRMVSLVLKGAKSPQLPARGSVRSDLASTPRPAIAVPHIWAMTNDYIIDYVERELNALPPSNVADSTLIGVLRPLFNQPVFIDIREELPETGLYRFCRAKQILVFYANRFSDSQVRGEALYSTQKLIYAQDELGKIYGPTFSAQSHCDRYGDDEQGFVSALPQRVLQRSDVEQKVSNILRDLRRALISVGLMDRPSWGPDESSDRGQASDGISALLTPSSGSPSAIAVSVRTTGAGPQTIDMRIHPLKLLFEPPSIVIEQKDLPEDFQVDGHTVTIERFTDAGFALNDHGVQISVRATAVEASRAAVPGSAPPTPQVLPSDQRGVAPTSAAPEASREPVAFDVSEYRLWADKVQKKGDEVSIEVVAETHAEKPLRIYVSNCYALDENGNRWETPPGFADSGHLMQDVAELIPGTKLRSQFKFVAKGATNATNFTFVCTEFAPRVGRRIVLAAIPSL
jgi:hypothetical protein